MVIIREGGMENRSEKIDEKQIIGFKRWSITLGIAMVALGLVTILLAGLTTIVSVIFLGIVLAIRGLIDVVHALGTIKERGFWWRLFSGTLSVIVGVMIFSSPAISALTLTYLIALFLIASGLYRAIAAPIEHGSQWGWVMLGGAVSLVVGFIVISSGPAASLLFIGLLIGIEILVQGMVMLSLPFTLRGAISTREIRVH